MGNQTLSLTGETSVLGISNYEADRELIENIDLKLNLMNFMEMNEFRPWEALKLLTTFLRLGFDELNRNTPELVGLPDMSEDLSKIRVTSAQFSCLWQQNLASAIHNLAGSVV